MISRDLADSLVGVIPKTMQLLREDVRRSTGHATLTQYRILARLCTFPRTNSELASEMSVSLPAMTRQMNIMVKAQWVTRVMNQDDRRKNQIAVTSEGKKVYAQIRKKVVADFTKRIENLDEQTRSELNSGVGALLRLIERGVL